MTPFLRRSLIAWFTLALMMLLGAADAAAQSDADRAAAQALFEEAQKLKKAGQMEQACEKFEASKSLDPATGTQLNLADCYEQIGKTASAWVNYVEVAEKDTNVRRARFAKRRADALKLKLTKLAIKVAVPVDGLVVKRGDTKVLEAMWGTAVPVDPGSHEITAEAPGKLPWRDTVEVQGEGKEVEVEIPPLEDAPEEDVEDKEDKLKPKPKPDGEGGGSGQTVAGGVVMGLGAAGVVAGAVLAGLAHSKYDESLEQCREDDTNKCLAEGVSLREEAQGLQLGYGIAFAAGGVVLLSGIITLATAPSGDDADKGAEAHLQLVPLLGPSTAGLQLTGCF